MKVLAIVLLIASVGMNVALDTSNVGFVKWMEQWGKSYEVERIHSVYKVWKSNAEWIDQHNAEGNHSYTVEMNAFGDLTTDQFQAAFCGLRRGIRDPEHRMPVTEGQVPSSVDWTSAGVVSAVGDQAGCGACYTFSATGAIEGAVALKTGKSVVPLSKQQLLDCSRSEGNAGCQGGLMDNAFKWVMKYGGIAADYDYPYTAREGSCQHRTPVARITSFHDIPEGNENALLVGLSIGPVSGGLQANQPVFQFYRSGIIDTPSCGTQPDHAILLTGYGTDVSYRKDYWTIKNSWGVGWGTAGYVRLVRGKNQCGISLVNSYPIA